MNKHQEFLRYLENREQPEEDREIRRRMNRPKNRKKSMRDFKDPRRMEW